MTPLLIFAIAGIGVYAIRLSGLAVAAGNREIPAGASKALHLVAPAAISAVVASAVLLDGGAIRGLSAWHVAALVAIGVAAWRRNLALTMGVGGAVFVVCRLLGW